VSGVGASAAVFFVFVGTIRVEGAGKEPFILGAGAPAGLIRALSNASGGPASFAGPGTRTLEVSRDALFAAMEESFSLWRSVSRKLASTLLDVRNDLPPPSSGEKPAAVANIGRPRTLVERALEVSNTAMFKDANVDAVFDVARILRELHVPAGHVFWRCKQPTRSSVRVFSGLIRCTNSRGESALVGNDFVLGTMSAFAGRPHAFDAVAETDVSAYDLGFDEFLIVLETHPELAMKFVGNLATMLARAI
jgi:CRP-like cAMP-binding protein